jgi:hypothetical protein
MSEEAETFVTKLSASYGISKEAIEGMMSRGLRKWRTH